MLTPRATLARRVAAALDASPSRIPVLVGASGSGRTTVLTFLCERLGRTTTQYVDVERMATTPERFLRGLKDPSPFPSTHMGGVGPRASFDETIAFLNAPARPGGMEPATFLLDEFLELRTFESFPGLRRVLSELAEALAASANRFVLTSRYMARTARLLRDRSSRFELIHMPPLTIEETSDVLGSPGNPEDVEAAYLGRTVHALADGRASYVRAIADELDARRRERRVGGEDAVSALAALLAPGGQLSRECHFSYELRLHRARGYGALKAILEIVAGEEGLTLTEISQRLQRTPGSTKDYLSWLEDVDLITARQKRYHFSDPLLRVWVRLYCRASAPTEQDLAREIHAYALPRLPPRPDAVLGPAEPAFAMAGSGPSGIIEID